MTHSEQHSSGTLVIKTLESQIISLGAGKPRGLNRIAKNSYGHVCLRVENIPNATSGGANVLLGTGA